MGKLVTDLATLAVVRAYVEEQQERIRELERELEDRKALPCPYCNPLNISTDGCSVTMGGGDDGR